MKALTLALALVALAATPAFADSTTTIEYDPNAPFQPGRPVIFKSTSLAMALSVALPAAIVGTGLLLKDPRVTVGLAIAGPVFSGLGQAYAGDPLRGVATGLMGPVVVAGGWGIGSLLGQGSGPNNGMWTALGVYSVYAALDAYTSADLANKKALNRAGITTP
ncbi:MAG: hypothetical protein JWM80_2262 [Cyanobacteria bacterium RYN_339]|nr:hypothetical protein [Cyanobacteria bacterium RYN_339]